MTKTALQFLLQKILGYERYLFYFALYSVYGYKFFKRDKEFDYFLNTIAQKSRGSVLLDIGANIGVTAIVMAQRFPLCQIIAFEPVSMHIRVMKRVIQYFGINNITIYQMAIGAKEQMVTISTPIQHGVIKQGWSFISGAVHLQNAHKMDFLTEEIQMKSLDAISNYWDSQTIAAIKIDVENYELFVLTGAQQQLQQHQPLVFVELWNNHRRAASIEMIQKLGYQVLVYEQFRLYPYQGKPALNFFFVPYEVSLISNLSK